MELRSAGCTKLLVYDGAGRVTSISVNGNPQNQNLYWEVALVRNPDNTISFLTPDSIYGFTKPVGLAATADGLMMKALPASGLNGSDGSQNAFKFRLRRPKPPLAGPGPDYSNGCKGVALAIAEAARLVEPVSYPGYVYGWSGSSFVRRTPPESKGDAFKIFEKDSVFLESFPERQR
jgi:hypothetical protein